MELLKFNYKARMSLLIISKIYPNLVRLLKGNSLSDIVKRNILASFLIKGINILLIFITVPVLLSYLDTVKYGLWLTIASVIQWFGFFDIGLGNGLRNKFAEAKAIGDTLNAKIYISTTYFILALVSLILIIILSPIFYFLDWTRLLNAPSYLNNELKIIVVFTFIFFMTRLVLQLIGTIILGDQKTALNDSLNPLSNIIVLLSIFVLTFLYKNSFVLASIILAAVPSIIYLIVSAYLFKKNYREYKPSLNFVKLSYVKPLFNLGLLFFIIQISGVVLYTTTNLLISHLLDPSEVTKYNIAYRYFSSVLMMFSIIVNPFWSAFTNAYTVKDFVWIDRIIKKLRIVGLVSIGLILLMVFLSDTFYKVWIGDKIEINFLLSLLIGLFFAITIFNMHICYFLNGIGRIKEQALMAVLGAIIHIPLSIILIKKFNFGLEGIILSLIIISLPSLFIYPYLYKKEMVRFR